MKYIALASTIDNTVIAADDNFMLLKTVAEKEFDIFVRIYKVDDLEYQSLINGNFDYRINHLNVREIKLQVYYRSPDAINRSATYKNRITYYKLLISRLDHALKKYTPVLSHQFIIDLLKQKEADDILGNENSIFIDDGFIKDYADENEIDVQSAATLIGAQYSNLKEDLRKIERLKIRYILRIQAASTMTDFEQLSNDLDKDLFVNMLL